MKRILLFDMDGVLVESKGYHRALQRTVAWAGEALGYRGVELSEDDIALVEAIGISSEWETAAICSALMLKHAAQWGIEISLPDRLPQPRSENGQIPPSLREFLGELGPLRDSRSALSQAEDVLIAGELGRVVADRVRAILRAARTPESVTYRTIQALVLGPEIYQQTYGQVPEVEVESYLTTYDRSLLSSRRVAELKRWLEVDGNFAAVFTNRPSDPPAGHVDPPEAQIGAKLIGLAALPIAGSGDLGWLAVREGKPLFHYLKPSPVHVLAAVQRALGAEQEVALLRALDVDRGSGEAEPWHALDGAEVFAFEDSVKGLISAQRAQAALVELDVSFDLELIGISDHPAKRVELEKSSSRIFDDLETALRDVVLE